MKSTNSFNAPRKITTYFVRASTGPYRWVINTPDWILQANVSRRGAKRMVSAMSRSHSIHAA